ncbi:hypothetical protein LINGRAHAP2_LOCUS31638 [Linum grandiflorum]
MAQNTIYCDGSFTSDSQKAGYGIIITNSNGHIIDGKAGSFLCNSAIGSEAVAIMHSIEYAKSFGTRTIIRTDCQKLVHAIYDTKHRWPWICHAYLERITTSLKDNPQVIVTFTPRAQNSTADAIAKAARRRTLQVDWLQALLHWEGPG